MSEHRFKIGQAVEYYPPRSMYASRGVYHITAELPVRAGEFEYRIKHPREDHERIAAESDLNELWDARSRSVAQVKTGNIRGFVLF
jgi:hypothetical protein